MIHTISAAEVTAAAATLTISAGDLGGDGLKSISFQLGDGVTTTTTAALSFTLDTTAPLVAISSPGGAINQASQTITGTVDVADAGATVTILDGATVIGSAIVQSDGSWSSNVTLSSGSNSLTAHVTDLAGNTATSSPVIYTLGTAAPVARPVTLTAGIEDASYIINASTLLAGVTDIDGPSVTITSVSVASGGGSVVDNHDGTFTYTPAANYNGPVSFNYTASDGSLTSSSTASLTLAAVNDAPIATPVTLAAGTEDTAYIINASTLLAGVADIDGPFPYR